MYKVSAKAHDPESVSLPLNFICDSNLWKLISFFRETRINLYLINLLVFLLFRFCRFTADPVEEVCINILPDSQSEMKHGRRKMKLNYLWNTCKQQRRRRHTRNRRHFWNIKMMRDCWSKKNRKGNFLQHAPLHYDYRSSLSPPLPPVRDILHPLGRELETSPLEFHENFQLR